jgi:hypothetical protein
MTYSTRPPVNPRFSSPPDQLDGLLHRFYRAQWPDPWPAAPRVASECKTTPVPRQLSMVRFFRPPARVAVAACVALLVIGYVALQSWFPDPRARPTNAGKVDLKSNEFARPLLKTGHSLDRTPSGQPVGVDVQKSPDNPKSFRIHIEQLPTKK